MLSKTYRKLLADLELELTETARDIKRPEQRLADRQEYREALRIGITELKNELKERIKW